MLNRIPEKTFCMDSMQVFRFIECSDWLVVLFMDKKSFMVDAGVNGGGEYTEIRIIGI